MSDSYFDLCYRLVDVPFVVSKVFEKLVNNRIVDHLEKSDLILISSMVLGLRDQLQIFWQLLLIELLELLTGLGLLKLWYLIYPRLLTEFGILVFFTNIGLMEFQIRYFALLLHFSVIGWFWIGSLLKNIQLMMDFHRGSFLVLHFSYYTLVIFLMMLSVILLSMLMILPSTLNVTRYLICSKN